MSKKIKILIILSFFLFFLLSPKPTRAFIGTGIFDYFTSSLEGVEEFSQFATRLFQGISYLLLITYIALGVSSYLLQWIITVPINLQNTLVLSGWNFTSGLANTFFILIFIIIALAYILKIGTIAQKKILTNLILAALLVNFSLLLVGGVTDVATFFYNTILGDEGATLLKDVFGGLMGGLEGMLTNLAIWLAGYVALYAIPFSAPFAQLTLTMRTIVTAAMLGVFGPTLMTWILTILFGLGVAGILFLYFFFFTVRMYIIWALAVFAPLAFICFILPQTKKYWDEWLKHLLEWTSLGIILLFWLVLGLKLMKILLPKGGPIIAPIVEWMQIGAHIQYFLFLFIYLVIGIYIEKKFTPALAATIKELGGQVGGAIWGRVIKPGWKAFKRDIPKMLAESEKVQKWAQRQALLEKKGWTREVLFARGVRRAIGRTIGPAAIEARRRDISKFEDEAEKIKTPELLESKFFSATSAEERIGYLSAAIKKGGPFKEIATKYVNESIAAAASAMKIGAVPEAERIARALLTENNEENKRRLKAIGFKDYDELTDEEKKKWDVKGLTGATALEKLVRETKGDAIKDFGSALWKSPEAMELINKFWHGGQIEVAGREFSEAFLKPFQETVNKKQKEDPEWYAINNPRLHRYLTSGAARTLGIGLTITIPRERLREIELLRDRPDLISATKERRETIKKIEELEKTIRAGGPPEELEKAKATLENLRKTLEAGEETLVKEEPKLKDLWEEERTKRKRR
jgi:hypothetical protein